MKTLQITYSDQTGGAARAAYRLHRALLGSGVESRMLVRVKTSDDWTVQMPTSFGASLRRVFIRTALSQRVLQLQHSPNLNFHSVNCLPSRWAAAINQADADVVNLHWMGADAMSIEDIGRITKPVVWTLMDMWAFCGAEHYAPETDDARWKNGYISINRPERHSGMDVDRWSWQRKVRSWSTPMQIVAPSEWLSRCVSASALLGGWPVATIPYVLDTENFKPLEREFARAAMNLPPDRVVVLFGAMGGGADPRKGFDLLLEGLRLFASMGENRKHTLCVIFGQSEPKHLPDIPLPTYWMGHIHDDATLSLLYSAADVMVVPSRQEALGQTATEAQACGCPVVAFDSTGIADTVAHLQTGYLARAYDEVDLAHGIAWVLEDKLRWGMLSDAARQRAVQLWSPNVVVPQYLEVYHAAVSQAAKVKGF